MLIHFLDFKPSGTLLASKMFIFYQFLDILSALKVRSKRWIQWSWWTYIFTFSPLFLFFSF